jgi:ribosome-associated heat shock protein Hsp15
MTTVTGDTTLRLDKWLWFARLAKTRSLAARLCAAGAVAVAGQTMRKPHHPVRVGDIVTLPQGRTVRTVHVAALGSRRGPAAEARQLYVEPDEPRRQPGQDDWTSLFDDGGAQGDRVAAPSNELDL